MTETERNRRKKSQNGAVAVMVTLIVLMICSTALLFLPEKEQKKKNNPPTATVTPTSAVLPVPEITEMLAVVLDKDDEIKMLTVYDVEAGEKQKLVYTGATGFYDGYGIQMSAAQLEKGGLYRFFIDTKEEWISSACEAVDRREKPENTRVWEKTGVEYITIAQDKISFRGQNYRYNESLCVMSKGKQITLGDLQPTIDRLTVRGIGQMIYEIVVSTGHGYITLENHEDFIGGVITIGSTKVDSIYENATYLVREGTYMVTVERGEYRGTESITVARDANVIFDVFDYGSGPIEKGWLIITVDPMGAELYIDGVKTAYTDGLELEYGTYQFEFVEGGYVSYQATVLIDEPKESLSVYLTEQQGQKVPDVDDPTKDPEDTDNTSGDTTSGDNTGDTTGDTTGENNTETGSGEATGGTMNSVSVTGRGYELNMNNAIYILGPENSEIYLDGEYLGMTPMDFEKIIGSYVITVIRSDGAVKNFNCTESDDGKDSYYNFSWID